MRAAVQPRGLWPVGLLLFLATGGQTGRDLVVPRDELAASSARQQPAACMAHRRKCRHACMHVLVVPFSTRIHASSTNESCEHVISSQTTVCYGQSCMPNQPTCIHAAAYKTGRRYRARVVPLGNAGMDRAFGKLATPRRRCRLATVR